METRKPAFKWVGERGLETFISEMEDYFRSHKAEASILKTTQIHQIPKFDLNAKNSELKNEGANRHISRLNSGSTFATFKNVGSFGKEELTFSNSLLNYAGGNSLDLQKCSQKQVTPFGDLTEQLVELLEKLSVSQKSFPVYRPTPIYPIGHYLSSPCSVRLFSHNFCRNYGQQFLTRFPGICWKGTKKTDKQPSLNLNSRLLVVLSLVAIASGPQQHLDLKCKVLNLN